jgi:predicted Holliday junction resolvase-like endonuclease
MAEADRNAKFQKISGKVEAAREKTTAAWQNARDELASEVANAKDKASEAAGPLENRAQTARDEASEQWHDIRGKRRGDPRKSAERSDG